MCGAGSTRTTPKKIFSPSRDGCFFWEKVEREGIRTKGGRGAGSSSTTAPSGLGKIPMLNEYDHSGIIRRTGLGGISVGICHAQIRTSVQMGKLESVQSGLLCATLPAVLPRTSDCLLLLCVSPKHTRTYGNPWQRTPWQSLCSPRTPVGFSSPW